LARATPPEGLEEAIEAEIAPYLACAPQAVARAKALARHLGAAISAQDIEHSIAELVACWEGEEAQDGISAFYERRKPDWAIPRAHG
jgi:methylglutaconyl-CoA hydratase